MLTRSQFAALAVWFLVAGFVFFQFLLQASTSVMVKPLMCDLQLTMTQIGLLSSSFFYPYLLLQIPAGLLLDRFGLRKVMWCSVALAVLASFAFAWAPSAFWASAARLLMGVASAPGVVCAMCLACRLFPLKWFPLMAGLVEMMGMLGGAVGQYVLAHLVEQFTWRMAMAVCGCFALVLWVLMLCVLKRRHECPHAAKANDCHSSFEHFGRCLKKVVHIPQVWVCSLYSGLMFSVIAAFGALWAVPLLKALYHASADHVAWISALLFVGAGLGTMLFGWLCSHYGRHRLWMALAALVGIVMMSLILYVNPWSQAMMALWFFVLGLASGGYAIPFALVKRLTCDTAQGTALGFANMMCILIGAPILMPLMGWILHQGVSMQCHVGLGFHAIEAMSLITATMGLALVVCAFVRAPGNIKAQ